MLQTSIKYFKDTSKIKTSPASSCVSSPLGLRGAYETSDTRPGVRGFVRSYVWFVPFVRGILVRLHMGAQPIFDGVGDSQMFLIQVEPFSITHSVLCKLEWQLSLGFRLALCRLFRERLEKVDWFSVLCSCSLCLRDFLSWLLSLWRKMCWPGWG